MTGCNVRIAKSKFSHPGAECQPRFHGDPALDREVPGSGILCSRFQLFPVRKQHGPANGELFQWAFECGNQCRCCYVTRIVIRFRAPDVIGQQP